MKNKTFCITASHYYPHPGGLETFVQRLSNELTKLGHKVIVLTHNLKTGNESFEKINDNLIIVRLDAWLPLKGRFPICKNNDKNKKLFEWLKNQNVNHYIINTRFYKLSNVAAKFANEEGITPILIDHGSAHLTMGNKFIDIFVEAAEHCLTKRLLKYNINYYGISRSSANWLEHFGIEAIGIIPGAIDADDYSKNASKRDIRNELGISKDKFIVYFVGRYTKEKGVLELLGAAKLIKNNDDIHFIFSGKGPYENLINKESEKLNIHNIGITQSEDVAAVMKHSNLMCLPSRSEGFCIALLEAAACKLPSLITKVGIADKLIINNSFGFILEKRDRKEIAKWITTLYNKKDTLLKIGENVYKEVLANYSWSNTAKKLLKEVDADTNE